MDQLIIKYLQGNLTIEEQHRLSKWIQASEKNRKVLENLEIYWHDHKTDLNQEQLEVRHRLLSKMIEENPERIKSQQGFGYGTYLKIAAVILLGLFLGILANQISEPTEKIAEISLIEKVSLPGQKITTVLPDGTTVKLNTESRIIAPSHFTGEKREVTLIGEAFFDVKRDENRPFIIKTADMEVTVLGTSFNVSAYKNELQFVAVKSGKVSVKNTERKQTVELDPLQKIVLDNKDFIKSDIAHPGTVFGWVDQEMVFNNQSIQEVLKQISKWYGVEVVMEKRLEINKKYTASFENPTLKEVMDILAFVYDFKYERKENELIIK